MTLYASVRRVTAALGLVGLLVTAQAAGAHSIPASFADLAARLLPSVVNISTSQIDNRTPTDRPEAPPGSSYEEFFRQFMERWRQENRAPVSALGSGFIIDPKGYIVTNNHVIEDADQITVTLYDKTTLEATVVGRDRKVDLALLKVEAETELKAVPFGDSSGLRVGDWVLAIGNPFGLGGTVTSGIVSAHGRDIRSGPYDDFIQTDASINSGNSGGPMFDLDGNVVGINTIIFSQSGGSIGIGFAIPSNRAAPIISQLREYGKARRGWLGVVIQDVTEEIARGLGLTRPEGALVNAVADDSPAEKGGIEVGDVILEFDGKGIGEMRQLPRLVAEEPVGRTVNVVVWRQGQRRSLSLALGEFPEDNQLMAMASDRTGNAEATTEVQALGMTLSQITPATRTRFGLDADAEGVVVTAVTPGGTAEANDIRPGMIVRKIGPDQRNVDAPQAVVEQVRRADEADQSAVLLLVEDEGSPRFVGLDIDRD